MSFEDLEEARGNCAAKEQASASKLKRGCKRKSDVSEELRALSSSKHKVVQLSDMPKPTHAPVSAWRAPVAKMY